MSATGPENRSARADDTTPDARPSTSSGDGAVAAEPLTGRAGSDADSTETTALPRVEAATSTGSRRADELRPDNREPDDREPDDRQRDDRQRDDRPSRDGSRGDADHEPTTVMPGGGATAATAVTPSTDTRDRTPAVDTSERDRASERAAAKAERQRALGVKSQPTPVDEPADPTPTKHNTDRFLGSLGLFLLRLVTAAVMGVHGAQKLLDLDGTTQFFSSTALPYPGVLAPLTAVAEVLIALALVLGLLVRAAGLGVLLVAVGALVFVHWYQNPFQAGQSGFGGEGELLLAGIGLLFICVGGGWWGVDAAMRRGRARRKAGA